MWYIVVITNISFLVKRAYHRLSLKTHPDRVAEELKVEATEKFKVISAIYSVLSNKSQRALYDKTGNNEISLNSLKFSETNTYL